MWILRRNGEEIVTSSLGQLDVSPQAEQAIEIPLPPLDKDAEYLLTIRFKLPRVHPLGRCRSRRRLGPV